jgi:hypothetical protein
MTFLSLKTEVNTLPIPSKSNKQKNEKKTYFFVGILKATEEKSRIPPPPRIQIRSRKSVVRSADPDPYQNVKDPQYCCLVSYNKPI